MSAAFIRLFSRIYLFVCLFLTPYLFVFAIVDLFVHHDHDHDQVMSVSIKRDRATGKNLGYGFVKLSSHQEARAAKEAMQVCLSFYKHCVTQLTCGFVFLTYTAVYDMTHTRRKQGSQMQVCFNF